MRSTSAAIRDERAITQTNPFQANPEERWRLGGIFCVARFSRTDLSMLIARVLSLLGSKQVVCRVVEPHWRQGTGGKNAPNIISARRLGGKNVVGGQIDARTLTLKT
ncbi:MAG: hypothetical protein JO313_13330 [Verrucomicrobia bacterium]|nr:hypothetical protein [Verrucomicrobiota bacterium]